jgi:hypothetical protein
LSSTPFYPHFSSPEYIDIFPIYFLDIFGIILNRRYLVLYKNETFFSQSVDLESRILDVHYWQRSHELLGLKEDVKQYKIWLLDCVDA